MKYKLQDLRTIYDRVKDYTMVPPDVFVTNLELAAAFVVILPGDVVECGVWRGGMSAGLALLLGEKCHYHLFDSFKGLPPVEPIDGTAAARYQHNINSDTYFDNCRVSSEHARRIMSTTGAPYTIHEGWFKDTLPGFKSQIALLRVDCDWFTPTWTCLDYLFDKVVPGGLIIFDDYYAWEGCRRAVDSFLTRRDLFKHLCCSPHVCYMVKP